MNTVVQTMQSLGTGRFVGIASVGLLLLGAMVFLSLRLSSPVMVPLYTNLAPEDSGTIITELGAMGVPFEISQQGSEVLVHSSDVLRLRMTLAQKGLPSKGSIVGYEIFDREQALGTSNFVLNVNLVRALEGELGRTISSLSSVKTARVHLVMPKRNLFERSKMEPSASVVLSLYNSNEILKEEAEAIKNLVSSAVPGLSLQRITIVDNMGRILSKGEGQEASGAVSASDSEALRIGYENRVKQTIENLLTQVVGSGKVEAQVSADLVFDRVTVSSEEFDPESQVARSTQTNEEVSESVSGDGGAVSVGNNLPNAGAGVNQNGSRDSTQREENVTNYEISKTVTSKVSEIGEVKQLSVAVLVDGRYEVTRNEETGETTSRYIPRSDEELAQIRSLVQSAIGYNAERGDKLEVVNMQFGGVIDDSLLSEDPLEWIKRDINSIVKTLVVGLVAILAIILVIRPLVNRAFDVSTGDVEDEERNEFLSAEIMADQGEGEVDMTMIQNTIESTPAKRVNELIENNPEETVSVLRTWMLQK